MASSLLRPMTRLIKFLPLPGAPSVSSPSRREKNEPLTFQTSCSMQEPMPIQRRKPVAPLGTLRLDSCQERSAVHPAFLEIVEQSEI